MPAELADGGAEPDRRVAARAADLEHLAAGPAGGEGVEERAARRRHLERALRDAEGRGPPRARSPPRAGAGRRGRGRRASAAPLAARRRRGPSSRRGGRSRRRMLACRRRRSSGRRTGTRRREASSRAPSTRASRPGQSPGRPRRRMLRGRVRPEQLVQRLRRSRGAPPWRRAFAIAASIFPRCRTIPASPSSRSTSRSPNARDAVGIEAGERRPERRPLAQDRQPREARLEALEAEPLVDPALVADGPAPFLVVVADVVRIGGRPAANEVGLISRRPRRRRSRPRREPGRSARGGTPAARARARCSRSKLAPWRGQTTVHVSASQLPRQSGPSSWEQRSSIARSSPSQL